MIDVFFCTADDKDADRAAMSVRCQERWSLEKDIRFQVLTPSSLHVSPHEFQRARRMVADSKAKSAIYIVTDDDCYLEEGFPLSSALSVARTYPDFSILSLWPINASIVEWTPEGDYKPFVDSEVMEHVSVGNVRFCRKKMLAEWPPIEGPGYDTEQCEAIRRAGKRSGYLRNYPFVHLGEGFSSIW